MKLSVLIVLMGLLFFSLPGPAATAAAEKPSVEKGKALFNDPSLGKSGKSCNDCHPDGKGIENAGGKKDLVNVINRCVTQSLKGKALKRGSVKMQSLMLYIKSLAPAKKEVKKQDPVGC